MKNDNNLTKRHKLQKQHLNKIKNKVRYNQQNSQKKKKRHKYYKQ